MKKSGLLILALLYTSLTYAQAWKKLSPMPVKLTFPVVAVLNGNIHVVGGGGTSGATDMHLRYTPSTDTWDTLAPVPYLAQQPGGEVVNGKLHFFGGGYPNSGTRLDDHYSYDPVTDKWTQEADLPIPRVIHKTAVLGDSIYVMSGQPDKQRVDVYNGQTKKWSQKSNLPDNDFWYSGITTYNGKIYRFGGGGSGAPSDAAHVYNPSADSWKSLSDLPASVHAPDAAVIGDTILIGGGYNTGIYKDGVWFYDIKNNSYSQGPRFNEPKAYHRMVAIGTCVYAVGGHNTVNPDSAGVRLSRYCKGDPFSSVSGVGRPDRISVHYDGEYVVANIKPEQGQDVSTINLYVTDLSGKTVYRQSFSVFSSEMIGFRVQDAGLQTGIYVVRAVWGTNETARKIEVQE